MKKLSKHAQEIRLAREQYENIIKNYKDWIKRVEEKLEHLQDKCRHDNVEGIQCQDCGIYLERS